VGASLRHGECTARRRCRSPASRARAAARRSAAASDQPATRTDPRAPPLASPCICIYVHMHALSTVVYVHVDVLGLVLVLVNVLESASYRFSAPGCSAAGGGSSAPVCVRLTPAGNA